MPQPTVEEIVADLVRAGEIRPIEVALASALPVQIDMILSKERLKAAVCGRRAGKTTAADIALLLDAEDYPNALYPYVLLTKSSGRDITWPVLKDLDYKFKLGLKFNDQSLRATLKNGATIAVMGADDNRDMERLRGSKYRIAIVDEAGSFPRVQLKYLVEDIIEPCTMDLRGSVWVIGSPNVAAQGYFYDLTCGATPTVYSPGQCATWHWTAYQNTHLPHAAEEIERIKQKRGWSDSTPQFRREYMGEWVRDASGLVYRFEKSRHVRPAPQDLAHYTLGIDLGASEKTASTAFVLLGFRDTGRDVWAVSAVKEAALAPDTIANRIETYRAKYNIERIVCDAGGLGNGYIKHFTETRQLPVEPAEKKDKAGAIEMLNGEFDGGRLFIDPGCHQLISEIEILPWNEERTDSAPGAADHACDSLLYAHRATYAYANKPDPIPEPKYGTPEYAAQFERKWRDRWSQPKKKLEWWDPRSKR